MTFKTGSEKIVTIRKKTRITPRILKHTQKIFVIVSVSRRQRQQHNAQVVGNIISVERLILLQHFDAARTCPLQHLTIRVFPIPQGGFRLVVDSLAWHRATISGRFSALMATFQSGGGEQGNSTTSRHLDSNRWGIGKPPPSVRRKGIFARTFRHASLSISIGLPNVPLGEGTA